MKVLAREAIRSSVLWYFSLLLAGKMHWERSRATATASITRRRCFVQRTSWKPWKETVAEQINSGARQQLQTNRKKLGSIIEAVICGRQGMPLRGHRDAGPLTLEELSKNDGNFRALLLFKMRCGDDTLKEHVLAAPGNATYLSPQIQNEILGACAKLVQENIVTRVNTAKCFALLADETTDI
ncbi:hypothetical protein HPB48_003678 [Haemaphysalis longicornis]|uniref:DUF4371 domain-containing protein n=1 Tax=Haemaphysalis longicornis TaxID=44386 RepID=A0A9J6FHT7_HAELO|nr:hypothetical protein HPB48_003678 [Haemaphysalis longicornis]